MNREPSVQDRRFPWRRVILILCFFILLDVALGAVGCRLLLDSYLRGYRTNFADIALYTGVRFPKGSKLLDSRCDGWTDTFINAKVEMSPADVPEFLASLPGAVTKSHTNRLGIANGYSDFRWWTPDSARYFEAVRVTNPKWKDTDLGFLIDFDDPSKVIVYMNYTAG